MKINSSFYRVGFAGLVAVLLFTTTPVMAQDVLLDHMEFIREQGKPQVATATFSACDPFGSFTLKVDNGQDGAHRVSSGSIAVNGAVVVSQSDFDQQVSFIAKHLTNVAEQNTIDVYLASAPGSLIKVTVTGEMICLNAAIISPVQGDVLDSDRITVTGQVRHRTPEVGVTVNGVLAQVNGDSWAANGVPLVPGENALVATVTDTNGKTVSSGPVTVTGPALGATKVTLLANVEGGVAPLAVTFSLKNDTGRALVLYGIDFEGDGIVDLETPAFENIRQTYTTEGVYYPTMTAVDASGMTFTTGLAVNVHPLPPLKSKWDSMKAGLSTRNVTAATRNFTPQAAALYNEIFAQLGPQLPQIALDMQDIQLVYLVGDVAKYRIRREEIVDGAPTQITYYIYFVRDGAGFWKLKSF